MVRSSYLRASLPSWVRSDWRAGRVDPIMILTLVVDQRKAWDTKIVWDKWSFFPLNLSKLSKDWLELQIIHEISYLMICTLTTSSYYWELTGWHSALTHVGRISDKTFWGNEPRSTSSKHFQIMWFLFFTDRAHMAKRKEGVHRFSF